MLGIARLIEAIPYPIGKVILQLRLNRVTPLDLHHSSYRRGPGTIVPDQTAIDDALVNRFGIRMPLVSILPLDAPTFRANETLELQYLFPKIAAAGRLQL